MLVKYESVHPKVFVCPSSGDKVGECSYVWRGVDLGADARPGMILLYDKAENHHEECRNVLFADGHVERILEEDFQEAIDRDNALRREVGLVEKGVDVGAEEVIPVPAELEGVETEE